MLQDVRYAFRALRRAPGFSATAALTLALGIGANTAIFSVVSAVLLRPLPYRDPQRLVRFEEGRPDYRLNISYLNFLDWRARARTFEDMAIFNPGRRTVLSGDGRSEVVLMGTAEARLFGLLGVSPAAGRMFTPDEHKAGAPSVALISHRLWQRRYGGAASIVGGSIGIAGGTATVVGVLPADFSRHDLMVLHNVDVWLPLGPFLSGMQLDRGNHPGFMAFARLRNGVDLEEAQREMTAIAADLEREYPSTNHRMGVFVVPLTEYMLGQSRSVLLPLAGAVGFVLLIACANVSNVLLARGFRREPETSVRAALGAGRWRLIRLFLAESLAIAAVGGGLGLLLGAWGVRIAPAFLESVLPRASDVAVNGQVLVYTVVLSFATVAVFGLAPALQLSRVDLMSSLRLGSASAAGTPRGQRLRSVLVAAEVALSLVLLVGAGLMLRTLARLAEVDPGYRPDGILTVDLHQPARDDEGASAYQFVDRLLERLEAAPAVAGAAASWPLDMVGPGWTPWINFPEKPYPEGQEPTALTSAVTPGYFDVMGVPLRRGRFIGPEDRRGAPVAIVVNETFVRRFLAAGDPIGRRVAARGIPQLADMRIVGVVGDTRRGGPTRGLFPEMYCAYAQFPIAGATIVVRASAGDPVDLTKTVDDLAAEIDPAVAISGRRRLADAVAATIGSRRIVSVLLGGFAALALVLTVIGIAGVVSYVVAQRTREIGVRMALGADAGAVVRLVLRGALKPVLVGLAAGAVAIVPLSGLLRSFLFQVGPADPAALAGGAVVLLGAAVGAAYVPARRAARVDPLLSLRS
jgi:putative ABC transport system permease protein